MKRGSVFGVQCRNGVPVINVQMSSLEDRLPARVRARSGEILLPFGTFPLDRVSATDD